MQGRRSLQGPCHPISLVLPKETGVTPQRKAPICDWRHSAPQCGAREITTWSSRMVNDVSHQNRALLPLVAALTGKLMRPSPRSGALPPHAVWPRAKRSKRTVGDAVNSFTIRDWNFSTTKSLVKVGFRLRHAPKRFSLWSLRGFFLTRQKEISQKGFAGAKAPAPRPAAQSAALYYRASPGASTRSVACGRCPPRSERKNCASSPAHSPASTPPYTAGRWP